MEFTSFAFLAFLMLAAAVFQVCPRQLRPACVLLFSYAFYCTWDPTAAAILLLATAACYGVALSVERAKTSAHLLLVISVVGLVAYIGWFKAAQALGAGKSFIAPLGISYYVFKLISYLVDVYWKKIPAEHNFIQFAAYVAFFPQIVAGPIQRPYDFLYQIKNNETPPTVNELLSGVFRILIGFLKKLVVAESLVAVVNYGFNHTQSGSSLPNILSFYLFPLQLYADFSGLTDIAIGSALLLGFRSPENFDAPFLAPNISEFWRRWHMSLTNWLRDYVFVPLQMATRNYAEAGLALSLTINMVLIGLWHGFTLPFLVFGLIHAFYLVVDAFSARKRKKYYKSHARVASVLAFLGPIFTYHLVALANVFFRASSFSVAVQLLKGLFGSFGNAQALAGEILALNRHVWFAFPAFAIAELIDFIRRRLETRSISVMPRSLRWSVYATACITWLFLAFLLVTKKTEATPFLYAMF
jgi:D-alanyl-lipoteichoic acid acyltransferase DltB (MBOAT superfamily)